MNTSQTKRNRLLGRCVSCLVLAGLLGTAGISHAGWVDERNGKTIIHVTVFGLPDPSNPDTFNRGEVAAVSDFKKRFPRIFAERYLEKYRRNPRKYGFHNWNNVELDLRKFTGIQVEGVEVDLLAIAGGMSPDVLYINFRKSDNYIQNRFLYPLDKPEDGYMTSMTKEEIDFRIHPKLWPVIRRKGPDGDKQVWAIPWGGALGKVLLFRKDLFDARHIPYPTNEWTWEDMLTAAKKLTDPEEGIYGLHLTRSKHESWYWVTFLWSAGGEAMTYNEKTDQWKCVFDTPEAAVALDFYTRLSAEKWVDKKGKIRRGYSTKDVSTVAGKWERGEIAMMYDYIDEKVFSRINPEVTGLVPVPEGPTGKRGGELNSRMMGLFSDIKDPAVRDAAWEYMRFYECEDAVRIKTRIMVEGGLGRFVNPKYLDMFGYPEIRRLAPKGWSEAFEVAIATGKPEPYGRNSNFAYDLMTFPIQEAEQRELNDKLPKDHAARLKVMQNLLKDACARANDEMIGIISPKERLHRRMTALFVLAAIVVAFALGFRYIFKVFTPPPTEEGGKQRSKISGKYLWPCVLLVPALATIFLWQYVPLLRGTVMAFMDYRLIGESSWVGIDNFGDLLYDRYWWTAVHNSMRYSFYVVSLTFLPPIILAIMLQEVPYGTLAYRIIFYLPAVVTGVVIVLLWKQFYQPTETGALNALVMKIPAIAFIAMGLVLLTIALVFAQRLWTHEMIPHGMAFALMGALLFLACSSLARPILFPPGETLVKSLSHLLGRLFAVTPEPYHWLSDPKTAMLGCVLPIVWAGMGPGCLIYLAALKGIPDDYYEAADLDGAGFFDKILFVVFPTLRALIIINFVGVFISGWYGAMGNILVMTGGASQTEVADLHIWYKAFTYLKFGPATAMAWMLGFMLIGFTVYQLRILSRVEFRAAGTEE
ncbi:MAG: extracellular solute-binding protein [Armatimonadetes bacterium]|nr:extracellular solute-binding protein [Armatimonadota bacterium]